MSTVTDPSKGSLPSIGGFVHHHGSSKAPGERVSGWLGVIKVLWVCPQSRFLPSIGGPVHHHDSSKSSVGWVSRWRQSICWSVGCHQSRVGLSTVTGFIKVFGLGWSAASKYGGIVAHITEDIKANSEMKRLQSIISQCMCPCM
jgi:hypothetical protein